MSSERVPEKHRAVVLETREAGLGVKTIPTPKVEVGSAVVKIEAAIVLSYHREVYSGVRHYSFPTPLVGGVSAIGRVAALGPDAAVLKIGQLVYVDCVIRGRDDPESIYLVAIHDGSTEGSKKLMRDVWRDGTFAEYTKAPLENCFALDEPLLLGKLGYTIPQLAYMCHLIVPFGGFQDIKVKPGEKVLVVPATGSYGGAAVQVAIAMGASVVAMGRNESELARIKEHVLKSSTNANIETVKLTGDEAMDIASLKELGPLDAILDLTPPQASTSTHLRSAMQVLRRGGRISEMGFNQNPVVPWAFVANDIMLKGKLMYESEDILLFIKMLNTGLLPRGERLVDVKTYKLEDWKAGLDEAAVHAGIGKAVVLTP